jgi:transcription elongation factor GreA
MQTMEHTVDQEEEIVLTQSGLESIEEELRRLVTVERPEVANRIRDAKDFGDLTENAEYEAAKTAQAFVEGRIIDLKRILASARILSEDEVRTDAVGIGSTVTVRDLEYGDDWTLKVVSPYEANPDDDLISDLSPVGRALMGHKVGDQVTVNTPGGTTRYEITAITK